MKRRVVITGLGAVTPLGVGAEALHGRWADGECGILDGAGACSEFEPPDHFTVKEARRLDRFSQFAVVAAGEALAQAGWADGPPYDPLTVGCVVATGIGGIHTVETQHDVMRDRGAKMVSPLGIPQYMPNAGAAAVSMKYGLRGQMFGVVSACSSGGHALGLAMRMIQYGDAEAVVAGGAEATLTEFGFACFNSMQALSPTGISRPFDARRDGFVMGEGAGMLVLEEESAARARGATILGELAGFGSTADAHHLTAPDPSGEPAARAITLALGDAGVDRGGDRLRQRPRHLDAAQRRGRDGRAKAGARGGAGARDPRLLDEVRDRPPARGCGGGRGGGQCADARHRADRADARLRRARSRARPRLRARRGPCARRARRPARRGAVELVRVRWPQRLARAEGRLRERDAPTIPRCCRSARSSGSRRCATRAASIRCAPGSSRPASALAPRRATASSRRPARSRGGRWRATRRTARSSAARSASARPTRSSACSNSPDAGGCRLSASSPPRAPGSARGRRPSPATGGSSGRRSRSPVSSRRSRSCPARRPEGARTRRRSPT